MPAPTYPPDEIAPQTGANAAADPIVPIDTGEAWQPTDQSWRDAWRWFFMSYLQAFAADGDGWPRWFWPGVMLSSATFLMMYGLYVSTDKVSYAFTAGPWYLSFVAADVALWLNYLGKKHKASSQQLNTKTDMTVSTETKEGKQ